MSEMASQHIGLVLRLFLRLFLVADATAVGAWIKEQDAAVSSYTCSRQLLVGAISPYGQLPASAGVGTQGYGSVPFVIARQRLPPVKSAA